jgi:hypothetical protein
LPAPAPVEARPERDRLPQYLMVVGLAALLLLGLPGLFAVPASLAWMAGVVLTGPVVGIPAGIAVFRLRHRAGAARTKQPGRPDGSRP